MREKDIENWIRRQIKNMGGTFMKFVSPGNNGVPDRIAIMPGGYIWFVELKTDTGELTPIQTWKIEQMKKLDVPVIVVRGMTDARAFVDTLIDEQAGLI